MTARLGTFGRAALGLAAAVGFAAGGCDDPGLGDDTGTVVIGLRDAAGGWFRLKILSTAPSSTLAGEEVYSTGCLEAKSRTYELTRIPAGDDRWVVIESFQSATCDQAQRQEVGYRGGIDIAAGGVTPYFHVPLYQTRGVTTLPEDLNISASLAQAIDFCATDAHCAEFGARSTCFSDQKPLYWCLPSCDSDDHCAAYHPNATCEKPADGADGPSWCVLRSPYPLNLGEPRALGHAATLPDGSVAFLGGFGRLAEGRLEPGAHPVEVFDVATGVFTRPTLTGIEALHGLSGFADLGEGRVALVGGADAMTLGWKGTGAGLVLDGSALPEAGCSGPGCLGELSEELIVLDFVAGEGRINRLPAAVAQPAVAVLDGGRLLVMGGYVQTLGGDIEATDDTFICDTAGGLSASCTKGPDLSTPRAGAAVVCLDGPCEQRVLVGGNTSGKLAELIEVDGDDVSFQVLAETSLPARIHGAEACGAAIIGGTTTPGGVGGLVPAWVNLGSSGLDLIGFPMAAEVVPYTPVWPAVARLDSGSCWVLGGLEPDGGLGRLAFQVDEDAVSATTFELGRERFGAMAAEIQDGPLKGSVIVGGGLRLTPGGGVGFVRGAEVLKP